MTKKRKQKKLTPELFIQSVNINYNDLNNLPIFQGDYDTRDDIPLPYFFDDIADNEEMTYESYKEFLTKFFFYYYFSNEFKEKVKDYYILLLKNQYGGIFPSVNDALLYAIEKGVPGVDRIIIPITEQVEYIHKYDLN
jgi:hypothetical protein